MIRSDIVKTMREARPPVSSRNNDKVTNGRLLPKTVDLRSAASRRFKHLVASYSIELGDELSEAEKSLIRQAVTLQLAAETMQEQVRAVARAYLLAALQERPLQSR
jgi:hypothetical protein